MLGKQVWEELVLAEADVGLVGVACVGKVALRRLEGKCGHTRVSGAGSMGEVQAAFGERTGRQVTRATAFRKSSPDV